MKLHIITAATITFILLPNVLFAEEEWETKLKQTGWVKLTENELKQMKDITLYHKSEYLDVMRYIDGTGKKGIEKSISSGYTIKLFLKIMDGKYCIKAPEEYNEWRCGSFWKKGNIYKTVEKDEYSQRDYTSRKGNPENL